jgi:glycosyltransferase involved in cell wall biosynthesis
LRLLFVGGDFRRKGGHHLLDAFERGLSGFCELDIVSGETNIPSGSFVRVHPGLTPNSPRLKQLYAQADVFLLPTQADATPNAIIEAMASGLPVITTRVGAIGELVEDGVTGYLVPSSDPQAIVDAVASLAQHREKISEMGRAARVAVEERFNAETNCKLLIAYLKEVGGPQSDGSARR